MLLPATTTTSLSDIELLALTLGHVSMRRAARLLARFHDLDGIARASLHDFALERMTARRAIQLQAAFELGRRSLARPLRRGADLSNAAAVVGILGARLAALDQEELHVLGVDGQMRLVVHFIAVRGSVNGVHVSPRDVFRLPVRENCTGVIVVHNHPTDDVNPSPDDHRLTADLRQAGIVLGIALHDHIIVGRHGHFSYSASRMLEGQEFGHPIRVV